MCQSMTLLNTGLDESQLPLLAPQRKGRDKSPPVAEKEYTPTCNSQTHRRNLSLVFFN